MNTKLAQLPAWEADIGVALDDALSAALQKWQTTSGHTVNYWLRGYCVGLAHAIVRFLGKPTVLASVLANDGTVHHVVAVLGNLMLDARGVNTTDSLVEIINREAEAGGSSLRAVGLVRFDPRHLQDLKECGEGELRTLSRCLNAQAMRNVRRRIKMFEFASLQL